jgi:hypothetical protein
MARLDDKPFNEFVTVLARAASNRTSPAPARQPNGFSTNGLPRLTPPSNALRGKPAWRRWKGSARRQLHERLFAKRPRKPAF